MRFTLAALLAALLALTGIVRAQDVLGPPVQPPGPGAMTNAIAGSEPFDLNPLSVLTGASRAIPNAGGSVPGSGDEPGGLSAAISVMLLLTVVTLAPSIILMTTCFTRILIVLALLRQALGTQSLPPPQVILSLALFMTALIMSPTLERIRAEAVEPYRTGQIRGYEELWEAGERPVRDFMFDQIEATGNWSSLYMVLEYTGVDTSEPQSLTTDDVRTTVLIPAFMLSELKTAFLMGFKIYLPFLVIDMVISAILISMSMMMLPPVLISLPFKLLLFVMVDGWQLVVGGLMRSFDIGNAASVTLADPMLGRAIAAAHAMVTGGAPC